MSTHDFDRLYRIRCWSCETVYEYTTADLKRPYWGPSSEAACPLCRALSRHTQGEFLCILPRKSTWDRIRKWFLR